MADPFIKPKKPNQSYSKIKESPRTTFVKQNTNNLSHHSVLGQSIVSEFPVGIQVESSYSSFTSKRELVSNIEKATHEQLLKIFADNQEGQLTQIERCHLQLEIVHQSIKKLSDLIRTHCQDQSDFLMKLWNSSCDLNKLIIDELTQTNEDLRYQVLEKTMIAKKWEEKAKKFKSISQTKDQLIKKSNNITSIQDNPIIHQEAIIRSLEEELIVKDKELLAVQNQFTSLSLWLPNFKQYGDSILSRFLPPIEPFQAQLSLDRSTNPPDELEQNCTLAQDYLYFDLKRFEKLGVGLTINCQFVKIQAPNTLETPRIESRVESRSSPYQLFGAPLRRNLSMSFDEGQHSFLVKEKSNSLVLIPDALEEIEEAVSSTVSKIAPFTPGSIKYSEVNVNDFFKIQGKIAAGQDYKEDKETHPSEHDKDFPVKLRASFKHKHKKHFDFDLDHLHGHDINVELGERLRNALTELQIIESKYKTKEHNYQQQIQELQSKLSQKIHSEQSIQTEFLRAKLLSTYLSNTFSRSVALPCLWTYSNNVLTLEQSSLLSSHETNLTQKSFLPSLPQFMATPKPPTLLSSEEIDFKLIQFVHSIRLSSQELSLTWNQWNYSTLLSLFNGQNIHLYSISPLTLPIYSSFPLLTSFVYEINREESFPTINIQSFTSKQWITNHLPNQTMSFLCQLITSLQYYQSISWDDPHEKTKYSMFLQLFGIETQVVNESMNSYLQFNQLHLTKQIILFDLFYRLVNATNGLLQDNMMFPIIELHKVLHRIFIIVEEISNSEEPTKEKKNTSKDSHKEAPKVHFDTHEEEKKETLKTSNQEENEEWEQIEKDLTHEIEESLPKKELPGWWRYIPKRLFEKLCCNLFRHVKKPVSKQQTKDEFDEEDESSFDQRTNEDLNASMISLFDCLHEFMIIIQEFELILTHICEDLFLYLISVIPKGPKDPLFFYLLEIVLSNHKSSKLSIANHLQLFSELKTLDSYQQFTCLNFVQVLLWSSPLDFLTNSWIIELYSMPKSNLSQYREILSMEVSIPSIDPMISQQTHLKCRHEIDRLGHVCLLLFDSLYQKDQKEKQSQGSYLKKKLEEPQPSYFYDNVCAHNILYPKSIHDPSDTQASYHLQSQYHFLDRLHLQIVTLFHVEHRKIMAAKLTNQIFTLFLFRFVLQSKGIQVSLFKDISLSLTYQQLIEQIPICQSIALNHFNLKEILQEILASNHNRRSILSKYLYLWKFCK